MRVLRAHAVSFFAAIAVSACGGPSREGPFVVSLRTETVDALPYSVAVTVPGGVTRDPQGGAAGALYGPLSGRFRVRTVVDGTGIDFWRTRNGELPDLHVETLDDGYVVTHRDGGFYVWVLRRLPGLDVLCEATSASAKERAAVLYGCLSLEQWNEPEP